MTENYYLYVKNKKVLVGKALYKEFNCLICKQKYSERKYRKNTKPFTESSAQKYTEEDAIRNIMIEKLYDALKQLTEEEYNLIFELFFNGRSERGLAREWEVHPMVIHRQRTKILEKLQKYMGI